MAFLKAKAEREEESAYKRQGALLAGVLKEKFDEAILAGNGSKPVKFSAESTPAAQDPGNSSGSGAFSAAQMEQLKVLLAEGAPQKSGGKAVKGPKTPSSTLRPVQVSLLSALFGNRFKLTTETTLEEFKEQVGKKWSQKPVVEAIAGFIKEHGNDVTVPKGKSERLDMFWSVLHSLD